jgi:hypothetical protein
VRTPEQVAAANANFFDEFAERVGRFAYGANRSTKYAQELAEWLAANHGRDERVVAVVSVLRDYRSKVGQEEAANACRDLIASVSLEVRGPTFPWRDPALESDDAWTAAFASSQRGGTVDAACPICTAFTLRRYYYGRPNGRGGLWEWCSTCFAYAHYQARVPHWWKGWPTLDRLPRSLLTHAPEYLERALRIESNG